MTYGKIERNGDSPGFPINDLRGNGDCPRFRGAEKGTVPVTPGARRGERN